MKPKPPIGWIAFLLLVAAGLFALPHLPGAIIPPCHFKQYTGLPCGTCGTYRGLTKLLEGDVAAALHLQPFVVGGLFIALVYGGYHLAARALQKPVLAMDTWSAKRRWIAGAIILLLYVGNWGYLALDGR